MLDPDYRRHHIHPEKARQFIAEQLEGAAVQGSTWELLHVTAHGNHNRRDGLAPDPAVKIVIEIDTIPVHVLIWTEGPDPVNE